MKRKVWLPILLTLVVLVGLVLPVSAATGPEPDSRKAVCSYCAGAFTEDLCIGRSSLAATVDCKTAGCTISYYKSTGVEYCNDCQVYVQVYGRHDCYHIHSSCGKGKIKTCPMTGVFSPGIGDYWN